MSRQKRKRGAPLGNQNARKHGFYSKVLTPGQEAALKASSVEGLDREIGIIRMKIMSVLSNDPQNMRALTLAMSSLNRLVRTRYLLPADAHPGRLPPQAGEGRDGGVTSAPHVVFPSPSAEGEEPAPYLLRGLDGGAIVP